MAREKISEAGRGVMSGDVMEGSKRSSGAVNGGVNAVIAVFLSAAGRDRSWEDEKSAKSGSCGNLLDSSSTFDHGLRRMLCGLISPWTMSALLWSHESPEMSFVAKSCQDSMPRIGSNIVFVDI